MSSHQSNQSCPSKSFLLRGLRPTPLQTTTKSPCGVCTTRCIYCDIWKLAILVYSHVPLRSSPPSSPQLHYSSLNRSREGPLFYPRTPSSSSSATADLERELDASFGTQRARLSSIMSICTVDGAEESEGLRLAHDRCLTSVEELIRRQKVLRRESRVEGLREQFMIEEGRREREAMTWCGERERAREREGYLRRGAVVEMAR